MILQRGDYVLTDEQDRFDVPAIAALLQTTYWAAHRSVEQIAESMRHSVCLSLTNHNVTVGIVRALTDLSVNSYICDFVIDPPHRGGGIGTWMLETLMSHPSLARTQQLLLTRDAQSFYEKHHFQQHPFTCMKRPAP